MLDWIKSWLESLWNAFLSLLGPIRDEIVKFVRAVFAVITFAGTLASIAFSVFDFSAAMDNIANTFETAKSYLHALPMTQAVAQANRLFPLNECLLFLSIIIGVKLMVIGLKIMIWFFNTSMKIVQMVVQTLKPL